MCSSTRPGRRSNKLPFPPAIYTVAGTPRQIISRRTLPLSGGTNARTDQEDKRNAVRTKPLARRTLGVGKGSGCQLRLALSWRLCVLARNYRRAGMTENAIAKEIVDAAFRIHTKLGPGLLESVEETGL